jgi:hypothetical protein
VRRQRRGVKKKTELFAAITNMLVQKRRERSFRGGGKWEEEEIVN